MMVCTSGWININIALPVVWHGFLQIPFPCGAYTEGQYISLTHLNPTVEERSNEGETISMICR